MYDTYDTWIIDICQDLRVEFLYGYPRSVVLYSIRGDKNGHNALVFSESK